MIESMVPMYAHQAKTFERAKDENEHGLFFDPGTGKTLTTINLLRYKFKTNGRILKTLILVPPVVIENWKRELAKFSKIPSANIHCLVGPGAKRSQIFKANYYEDNIFITNYETLLMPELFEAFQEYGFEILVFDESHKIKSEKAKRTKAAIKLSNGTRYRYILTGTPALNSPMDLFSQFLALDKGKTFGTRFYVFRNKYFFDKNASMRGMNKYFPDWRVKPGAIEEISEKIAKKTSTAKLSECIDLPELVRKKVYVELSRTQRKAYDEMKKDFITFMGESAVTAELAITKALRLQQIVSGFVKTEDGVELEIKDNPRLAALKELLEEITPGHKVLVWAIFQENYRQIKKVIESLDLEYVEVTGEVSPKQRQENVDRFENDKNIRVLLGHPGAGGIGLNLVSASYSIYYSRGFSLEHDIQSEARNYRQGSQVHSKVIRIDIIAQETIDNLVLESLAAKVKISEQLLRQSLGEI